MAIIWLSEQISGLGSLFQSEMSRSALGGITFNEGEKGRGGFEKWRFACIGDLCGEILEKRLGIRLEKPEKAFWIEKTFSIFCSMIREDYKYYTFILWFINKKLHYSKEKNEYLPKFIEFSRFLKCYNIFKTQFSLFICTSEVMLKSLGSTPLHGPNWRFPKRYSSSRTQKTGENRVLSSRMIFCQGVNVWVRLQRKWGRVGKRVWRQVQVRNLTYDASV